MERHKIISMFPILENLYEHTCGVGAMMPSLTRMPAPSFPKPVNWAHVIIFKGLGLGTSWI